jgi:hypothetical protein
MEDEDFEGNYLGEVVIKMDEYEFHPTRKRLWGWRFNKNEKGFTIKFSKVNYIYDRIREFFGV